MGTLEFSIDETGSISHPRKKLDQVLSSKLHAIWRVRIINNSSVIQKRILWNFFHLEDAYLKNSNSTPISTLEGKESIQHHQFHTKLPSFTLEIPPGNNEYFLDVRMKKLASVFSWRLTPEHELNEIMRTKQRSTWFFIVTFLVMWTYTSIYFAFIKNKHYFFYSTGIFFLALSFVTLNGVPLPISSHHIFNLIKFLPLSVALAYIFIGQSVAIIVGFDPKSSAFGKKILDANVFFSLVVGTMFTLNIRSLNSFLPFYTIFELTLILSVFMYYRKKTKKKYWRFYFFTNVPIVISIYSAGLMFGGVLPFIEHFAIYAFCVVFLANITIPILMNFITNDQEMERARLESCIQLGKAVQSLLIPKVLKGKYDKVEFSFIYKTCASQMSGDWIFHWMCKNGNKNFLLGDVVGKGPSAAITVSMIAAIVERCKRAGYDAHQSLLEINDCLYEKFSGKILTSCSATTITPRGEVITYNASGLGWLHVHQEKSTHFLGRGHLLGLTKPLQLNGIPIILEPNDLLFSITDGYSIHPRQIRKLSQLVSKLHKKTEDVNEISQELESLPLQAQDDQAMVLIAFKGQEYKKLSPENINDSHPFSQVTAA